MFRALKKHIALLFSLILLWATTPVGLWHHCDHHDKQASEMNTSEATINEKCAVCDYNFHTATNHTFHFNIPAVHVAWYYFDYPQTLQPSIPVSQYPNKAPPVNS